ncbi:hypothetical protein JXC34_06400 [Candidatus Woesearchaeota archaeon]|nr:hypothetical protein [Candidatus Woesearchaeota archaeon]
MAKIETGADRLVDLIAQEKEISVDDAAKKLGISKVVIMEWAEFLEEEKIISIDYKFSKTILKERKLTREEVKVKEKEYSSTKDAFVRRVESSLKNLDRESLGLEKIKTEFQRIKDEIGSEMDNVKEEVSQLQKYEELKKNLDKDIEKQIAEFKIVIDNSHRELDIEQKRHQELLEELEIEKRELQVKEHRLMSIEEKEKEIMERLQNTISLSKELQSAVENEKSTITHSKGRIFQLENAARKIESNIQKKKNILQPMVEKAKQHEAEITKLQQDILNKASQKTEEIRSKVEEGTEAVSKFETFFKKKAEIETLIAEIDKEKKDIQTEFDMLSKKALAFDIASKSNTVATHMKLLEKNLEEVNKKKSKFKFDLERLINLIKGT